MNIKKEYIAPIVFILMAIVHNLILVFFLSWINTREDNYTNYLKEEKKYRDSLYSQINSIRDQRVQLLNSIDSLKEKMSETEKEIAIRINKLKFNNDKAFSNWVDSSSSAILTALLPK
jgi:peptidoglycan hydrolase CwlO-like protein